MDVDPRKLPQRRSSLVVADLPLTSPRESRPATVLEGGRPSFELPAEGPVDPDKENALSEKNKKKKPTVLDEVDPNSLLDSFGF